MHCCLCLGKTGLGPVGFLESLRVGVMGAIWASEIGLFTLGLAPSSFGVMGSGFPDGMVCQPQNISQWQTSSQAATRSAFCFHCCQKTVWCPLTRPPNSLSKMCEAEAHRTEAWGQSLYLGNKNISFPVISDSWLLPNTNFRCFKHYAPEGFARQSSLHTLAAS